MEAAFTTTDQDLLIAAVVLLLGLVALIGSLYLTRKGHESQAEVVVPEVEGTIVVEENGVAVRRSTRQRKPVMNNSYADVKPRTPRAAKASEDKTPKAAKPASTLTTPLQPSSPRGAAQNTPATAGMTSPGRQRRSTAARAAAGSPSATPSRRTRAHS